jgi:hypothetical protein
MTLLSAALLVLTVKTSQPVLVPASAASWALTLTLLCAVRFVCPGRGACPAGTRGLIDGTDRSRRMRAAFTSLHGAPTTRCSAPRW